MMTTSIDENVSLLGFRVGDQVKVPWCDKNATGFCFENAEVVEILSQEVYTLHESGNRSKVSVVKVLACGSAIEYWTDNLLVKVR